VSGEFVVKRVSAFTIHRFSLDVEQVDHQRTFAIPAPLARAKRGFSALEQAPKALEGSLDAK
jgi:hypothetical protein